MDIDLISDEFNLHQPNAYSLWLYIGDNSCSVSILDDAERRFVGMKQAKHISLAQTIELFDELAAIPFARVFISVDTHPALLVPSTLYRDDDKSTIFGFSTDFNDEHEIVSHHLPALSIVSLFSVTRSFLHFISPYFPNATIMHMSSALLVAVEELSRSAEQGIAVGVRLAEHSLHICIFNFGRLLFFNQFVVQASEDVAYWILRICEQFSINPGKLKLYVEGIDNAMEEKAVALKPYFSKISTIPFPSMYSLAPELKAKAIEETGLFYLPLCES